MSETDTTAAILLGASAFPHAMSLDPSPAFANAHKRFATYLRSSDLCSEEKYILDLFDSELSNSELDSQIADWLSDLSAAEAMIRPKNLIVYYVGHGGFKESSEDYFLAIRSTRDNNPYFSSIPIASLAKTIRENARGIRRFLILDACFAGAAIKNFMSPLSDVVESAILNQSWGAEQPVSDGITASGTALLCSSSKDLPSRFQDNSGTMFTSALLHILENGVRVAIPKISLQMLHTLTWQHLKEQYKGEAIRPEVHCPDQRQGNISTLPFFPNAGYLTTGFNEPESELHGVTASTSELQPAVSTQALGVEDMYALLQSGNELAAELELQEVLNSILELACDLTKSKGGSILFYSDSEVCEGEIGCFYFAAATGPKADMLLQTRGATSNKKIPMKSMAGTALRERTAKVSQETFLNPDHNDSVDLQTRSRTESLLSAPLIAAGEPLGVMQVLNTVNGTYSDRDKMLIEYFANQAALAIRNATLFRDVLSQVGFPTQRGKDDTALSIVRRLNMPATKEYVTVMFIDIRSFTEVCNSVHSPESIQDLLNAFVGLVSEIVQLRHGMINKFLGDGVLAIFSDAAHETNAVECALDIISRFQDTVKAWKKRNKIAQSMDFVDIGAGIVSDHIIVGTIGNESVRDYTTIGAPVNLAAALEFRARDGVRILVNENTFFALPDGAYANAGPFKHQLAKTGQGVIIEYDIYEIKGRAAADSPSTA